VYNNTQFTYESHAAAASLDAMSHPSGRVFTVRRPLYQLFFAWLHSSLCFFLGLWHCPYRIRSVFQDSKDWQNIIPPLPSVYCGCSAV